MKPGDEVYFIENNRSLAKARIIRINSNLFIIKTSDGKGLCLPRHRLFKLQSEAEQTLNKGLEDNTSSTPSTTQRFRKGTLPYDHWA